MHSRNAIAGAAFPSWNAAPALAALQMAANSVSSSTASQHVSIQC